MVPEPETLEFDEALVKQAARGDEMPSGLEYFDQITYLELRSLYASYRMQIITADQASREKKEILTNYKAYKWQWLLVQQDVGMRKATEMARAAYRKNRTLENADALVLAIEGVPV